MNGTEWTEPGQGASVRTLFNALYRMEPKRADRDSWNAAYGHLPGGSIEAVSGLRRTNLRLTGSPLTADDLKRIEQCEVTR